jgi:hypothetical protein
MSFVPVGGKTLGIQIATSGKARLLRTLFGVRVGLMRLNFLSFGVLAGPAGGKKLVGHRQQVVQRRGDIFLSATKLFFSVGR